MTNQDIIDTTRTVLRREFLSNYRYRLMRLEDVKLGTEIYCDLDLSEAELVSYLVALNLTMIPRDTIGFYATDAYTFVGNPQVIVDTGDTDEQ